MSLPTSSFSSSSSSLSVSELQQDDPPSAATTGTPTTTTTTAPTTTTTERVQNWLSSFRRCGPRYQILRFFNDVANDGGNDESIRSFDRSHISKELRMFDQASVFTVWRPTSTDAIRRMILGEGVGKGLDIKGKSAKRGTLSAFVPFLQIHHEEHKTKIRTLKKNAKLRIFFDNAHDRDCVQEKLERVGRELHTIVKEANRIITEADKVTHNSSNSNKTVEDDARLEQALEQTGRYDMDWEQTTIDTIDTYIQEDAKYGLAVQERIFWEGMVMRQSITRVPQSDDDTGRASIPSFQDMNFSALRSPLSADIIGGHTRAVLLQYRPPSSSNSSSSSRDEKYDPMCPLNLVMAYEENDPNKHRQRVIPCVSDFDCFIVGSRGVRYEEEVPDEQLKTLQWSIDKTEAILSEENTDSWTKRWLDVLKECADTNGYTPKIPPGGYSDPKTKFIFKHAIDALSSTGCVRHGAECFNYYFPQELDEEFLVISDQLPSSSSSTPDDTDDDGDGKKSGNDHDRKWAYVNAEELKSILISKINDGYAFPLNPKWVLCDPGWKAVYDQLMTSRHHNISQAVDCFYPPHTGIRERIEAISKTYPNGFRRKILVTPRKHGGDRRLSQIDGMAGIDLAQQQLREFMEENADDDDMDGTDKMALAEQELKYHVIFQRARRRLKVILMMKRLHEKVREVRNEQAAEEDEEQNDG